MRRVIWMIPLMGENEGFVFFRVRVRVFGSEGESSG